MTRWIGLVLCVLLAMPVAAPAAPAEKVVIAQGVDPTTLDIMNQQETPASVVGRHIFEMLVERDQNLKLVPALAAELPKLVSPQVWEVKLRRGVKFHNGEDFTSESVKFSLERAKDSKMRASSNFRPIDRVEIVDPYTVRVHTSKPWPIFAVMMNAPQTAMYPPKAYAGKESAEISKNPIGTGPYKFVRWSKDEEIVLEAVAGQLTKAGFKVTVRTYEFVNYLNNMVYVHRAGPVWLIGWGQGSLDAEGIYVPLFRSGNLLSNYHNPDFDRMVDEAQTIMDDKKRLEQYHRINKLWLDDQAAVPLYQQIDLYGASRRLNWKSRSDELIKAYDMSLKEGS